MSDPLFARPEPGLTLAWLPFPLRWRDHPLSRSFRLPSRAPIRVISSAELRAALGKDLLDPAIEASAVFGSEIERGDDDDRDVSP